MGKNTKKNENMQSTRVKKSDCRQIYFKNAIPG